MKKKSPSAIKAPLNKKQQPPKHLVERMNTIFCLKECPSKTRSGRPESVRHTRRCDSRRRRHRGTRSVNLDTFVGGVWNLVSFAKFQVLGRHPGTRTTQKQHKNSAARGGGRQQLKGAQEEEAGRAGRPTAGGGGFGLLRLMSLVAPRAAASACCMTPLGQPRLLRVRRRPAASLPWGGLGCSGCGDPGCCATEMSAGQVAAAVCMAAVCMVASVA